MFVLVPECLFVMENSADPDERSTQCFLKWDLQCNIFTVFSKMGFKYIIIQGQNSVSIKIVAIIFRFISL